MKKIITALFFTVFISAFGEIKDSIGLFSDTQKAEIDTVIEKIEKEKEIKIYLNTVIGEESFQIENPQKTFIITYQQINKDVIVTELKFTEDLGMSAKSQEIDLVLDSLKEYVFQYDYVEYTKQLLEQINTFIVKISEEEQEAEKSFSEDSGEKKKSFFKKIFSRNP